MSKEIKYADVRVGDVIEGAYTDSYYDAGEAVIYRGVVTKVEKGRVRTKSFLFTKDLYPTLTLIERPERVEPTTIGTMVKMGNGRTAILTPLTKEFRLGGDQSRSPWLYFPDKVDNPWATGNRPEFLTWTEVLGKFGQGVVEIIEP